MFYSFKNLQCLLNNQEYIVDSVALNTEANVVPVYDVGNALNRNYKPVNGIAGSLSLSYFPTGIDLIKNCINNTHLLISGNIGGFYFSSGYLSNYTLTARPNSPVAATAEILFFEEIKGSINTISPQKISKNILTYSDLTINTNSSSENLGNINSLNYNYSVNLTPIYYIGSQTGILSISPDRVSVGEKIASINVDCDSVNLPLSYTGVSNVGATLFFNNPATPGIRDNLACSGTLISKGLQGAAGGNLKTSFSIIENNIYNIPKINSLTPDICSWGDYISINGENLDNYPIASFVFGKEFYQNNKLENITVVNSNQIVARIPSGTLTDYIVGMFIAGDNKILKAESTGKLKVNYSDITVNSLNPNSYLEILDSGKQILITGTNFYHINRVLFGEIPALFDVDSSTSLRTSIPRFAETCQINIVSDIMVKSGQSSTFIMPPFISGISPSTGYSGTFYRITGRNFLGVDAVKIGNRFSNFEIVNNNLITGLVPSGNTNGFVKLIDNAVINMSDFQRYTFSPILRITGCNPQSGKYLERVTLTTSEIIDPELLLPTGNQPNEFLIYFGGVPTGFIRTSHYTFTGLVPSGFVSGTVAIANPTGGGAKYPSDVSYLAIFNPLITSIRINSLVSNYLISGKGIGHGKTNTLHIIGANLHTVTGLMFTGTSGYSNSGGSFIVQKEKLFIKNGTFLSIEDYTTTGNNLLTGMYDIEVRGSGNFIYRSGAYVTNAPNLCLRSFARSSGSSTFSKSGFNFDSRLARDGIRSGTSGNYGMWMSIYQPLVAPWWEVDLGANYSEISEIHIYTSNAGEDYTLFHNNGIRILDQNRNLTRPEILLNNFSTYIPYTGIFITGVTGRYVHIKGFNDFQMGLAEVEVY